MSARTIASQLPEHLAAMQMLVNRCPTAIDRKHFVVAAGCSQAISFEDARLLITANGLETV